MASHMLPVVLLVLTYSSLSWVHGANVVSPSGQQHHDCLPFKVGQQVRMQCKNLTGEWGPGPVCTETGKPMTFQYGVDTFHYCGWSIKDEQTMAYLRSLVSREESWKCRVEMALHHEFWVPFSIPVWGIAEPNHMHVGNHMNFVFHADEGKIIAATAYPVRDRFQMAEIGSSLQMHGPVKWFQQHSFRDYHPLAAPLQQESILPILLPACALTTTLACIGLATLYHFHFKPAILQSVQAST